MKGGVKAGGAAEAPNRPLRVMFCAGENSGDQHASRVIEALRRMEPDIELFGFGGDRMEQAGMRLEENLAAKLPIIGATQAIMNIRALRKLLKRGGEMLRDEKPDLFVPVDYPGFNLQLCEKAHGLGVPVAYFISPQIWAWHHSRIKRIRRCVRRMLVILPFEEAMYRREGVDAVFVGHPLADDQTPIRPRAEVLADLGIPPGARVVGLLPGSRDKEIERHLDPMLGAAQRIAARVPGCRFVLPRASTVEARLIEAGLARHPGLDAVVTRDDHKSVCAAMDFALCKSGTSTLELALLGVPMLVMYKASALTAFIVRRMALVKWIGLVNIVAGEAVAPELLQENATAEKLAEAALEFLDNPTKLADARRKLAEVARLVGGPGAAQKTAELILELAREARGA